MNYGVNGTGGSDGTGDMSDIWGRLTAEHVNQGTEFDEGAGGQNSRRFYFDHMRARIVLTNTGTSPIFWEVYECVARKDIPLTFAQSRQGIFDAMQNEVYQGHLNGQSALPNTDKQISSNSVPTPNSTGVTPFQFRDFCQKFKIMKVTRLQASAGNTVSFDASNPRNVTVNWDDCQDLLAKRGISKLYLIRQWGAVIAGEPPTESASSSVCEIEKDYNVKLLDTTVPQLNYFTYTNSF